MTDNSLQDRHRSSPISTGRLPSVLTEDTTPEPSSNGNNLRRKRYNWAKWSTVKRIKKQANKGKRPKEIYGTIIWEKGCNPEVGTNSFTESYLLCPRGWKPEWLIVIVRSSVFKMSIFQLSLDMFAWNSVIFLCLHSAIQAQPPWFNESSSLLTFRYISSTSLI